MKPKFIDHIVIVVKSVSETKKFYSSFLGKPIYFDKEQVAYQVGNTKIFFGLPYGKYMKYNKNKSGLNHLAFGVRSLKELRDFKKVLERAKIRNSGIKIDKYGGNEFIYFNDPNGTRLEFYLRKKS